MTKSRTTKTLLLSSGQTLTALVGVISAAILTRVLTTSDFGSYRQALLAYSFATPFIMLGLDRVLFTFLPGETTRCRSILFENLCLLVIGGALLSCFLFFGGNHLLAKRFNNPSLAPLVSLMFFYPLLMFPMSALPACLLSQERTEFLTSFNVLSRLLLFLITVVPTFFWPTSATAIIGQSIGAALTSVAAIYLMFRVCPPGPIRLSWEGMKKQLFFSVPLGLSTIVGSTGASLDQLLVSSRCTPEMFAVYSIGAMEIPLIGIVTGALTSVVMVDYALYHKRDDCLAILALMKKVMLKAATVIFPVMMFLFCIAPELMRVLYGKDFAASALPFRIYLFLLPRRIITFGAVLQATGNSRYILITSILDLCANALLSFSLIGWLGAPGAALGTLAAGYLVEVPCYVYITSRILKCRIRELFPWGNLGKLLIMASFASLMPWGLKAMVDLNDVFFIAVAGISYFSVIGSIYLFFDVFTINAVRRILRIA